MYTDPRLAAQAVEKTRDRLDDVEPASRSDIPEGLYESVFAGWISHTLVLMRLGFTHPVLCASIEDVERIAGEFETAGTTGNGR